MPSPVLNKALQSLPAEPLHRIRVALAFRGRTQTDLAGATAINEAKLSKALNGHRAQLSGDEQDAVARELDVPRPLLFTEAA